MPFFLSIKVYWYDWLSQQIALSWLVLVVLVSHFFFETIEKLLIFKLQVFLIFFIQVIIWLFSKAFVLFESPFLQKFFGYQLLLFGLGFVMCDTELFLEKLLMLWQMPDFQIEVPCQLIYRSLLPCVVVPFNHVYVLEYLFI